MLQIYNDTQENPVKQEKIKKNVKRVFPFKKITSALQHASYRVYGNHATANYLQCHWACPYSEDASKTF